MNAIKHTIHINGRTYNAMTGKPIAGKSKPVIKKAVIMDVAPATSVARTPVASKPIPKKPSIVRRAAPNAHRNLERSHTLRRDIVKKPIRSAKSVGPVKKKPPVVARSPHISRFYHPQQPKVVVSSHIAKDHELTRQAKNAAKAHAHHVKTTHHLSSQRFSSRAIKERLLEQQLEKALSHVEQPVTPPSHVSPRTRMASIIATCLMIIFLGSYLTYVNIPNFSIRLASASAGIEASLPKYQPSGFRLSGPILHSPGEVEVKYKQTGGDEQFKLVQRTSDWDPDALLENFVAKDSQNDYQVHSAQGLTVYTYDHKAAWVNGGVLHTIDGNAPLSNGQITRIASSM
jgi:hypothetical protein